jgi:hypothetical protein
MSVNPNQTNANTTTTFYGAGGGGGSNFPSGITIGGELIQVQPTALWGQPVMNVSNPLTGSNLPFSADSFFAYNGSGGTDDKSGTYGTSTIFYQGNLGTAVKSEFLQVIDNQLGGTSAFNIKSISSITGTMNTTASPPNYNPLFFTLRPDQGAKGGDVYATFNWDAVDTGANVACRIGANSQTAYIGAEWLGYITMPMAVYGATITMASDNETFFFMDGKEGRQGSISTGTSFISGSNQFSSITSSDGQNVADMDALLSTLKALYPNCFLP